MRGICFFECFRLTVLFISSPQQHHQLTRLNQKYKLHRWRPSVLSLNRLFRVHHRLPNRWLTSSTLAGVERTRDSQMEIDLMVRAHKDGKCVSHDPGPAWCYYHLMHFILVSARCFKALHDCLAVPLWFLIKAYAEGMKGEGLPGATTFLWRWIKAKFLVKACCLPPHRCVFINKNSTGSCLHLQLFMTACLWSFSR